MTTPLVSVFTPSHDPTFLTECYDSLTAQTYERWEWVVALNNGAEWEPPADDRVTVVKVGTVKGVGEAKQQAVVACRGDILVELDHDDLLLREALREIVVAFDQYPDAGLVYSQCAEVDAAGDSAFTPYAEGYGWRYRKAGGRQYPVTPEPTPHNVSYIWYAPNHLRAFTRLAYDKAGGYNPDRDILDDQDLMARLYEVGTFRLVDEVLYLQRTHDGNTQKDPERNPRIQVETVDLYDRTIQPAALAWAERENLPCLDLGGAHGEADPRYLRVDQHAGEGVDLVHTFPAPLAGMFDSSVGVIRAVDFLEHVADKVAMMNEIHRLLRPGGMLLSMTPSTDGRGAFQDPTHVAFWNENSFWYYTDPNYTAYVPEITAKFQVSRLFTGFPSDWHRDYDIPYVFANLIAVKDGTPRNGGFNPWA